MKPVVVICLFVAVVSLVLGYPYMSLGIAIGLTNYIVGYFTGLQER